MGLTSTINWIDDGHGLEVQGTNPPPARLEAGVIISTHAPMSDAKVQLIVRRIAVLLNGGQ
jgi:hypothetical protein